MRRILVVVIIVAWGMFLDTSAHALRPRAIKESPRVDRLDSQGADGAEGDSIRGMPAYHILQALGLQDRSHITEATIVPFPKPDNFPPGLKVQRIRLSPRTAQKNPLKGVGILQSELHPAAKEFDLLYADTNHLIAIFPVLSKKDDYLFPAYFYLGDLYFEIPPIGSRDAGAKAERFLRKRAGYYKMINIYKDTVLDSAIAGRIHGLPRHNEEPWYQGFALFEPYQIYGKGISVQAVGVGESYLLEVLTGKRHHAEIPGSIVVPTPPTVYSQVTDDRGSDLGYYSALSDRDFGLTKGQDVLVIGPGMGLDAYAVALTTGKVYIAGVNPLEVAIVRALQEIAGRSGIHFELYSETIEAFSNARAIPFKGRKFDRVLWNMGYMDWEKMKSPRSPSDFKDGLPPRYIRNLARALPHILKHPDSQGLFWNQFARIQIPESGRIVDGCQGMFESAGTFNPKTGKSATPNQMLVKVDGMVYHVRFPPSKTEPRSGRRSPTKLFLNAEYSI